MFGLIAWVFGVGGSNGANSGSIISKTVADGHPAMTVLSRVTLASAGFSCSYRIVLAIWNSLYVISAIGADITNKQKESLFVTKIA